MSTRRSARVAGRRPPTPPLAGVLTSKAILRRRKGRVVPPTSIPKPARSLPKEIWLKIIKEAVRNHNGLIAAGNRVLHCTGVRRTVEKLLRPFDNIAFLSDVLQAIGQANEVIYRPYNYGYGPKHWDNQFGILDGYISRLHIIFDIDGWTRASDLPGLLPPIRHAVNACRQIDTLTLQVRYSERLRARGDPGASLLVVWNMLAQLPATTRILALMPVSIVRVFGPWPDLVLQTIPSFPASVKIIIEEEEIKSMESMGYEGKSQQDVCDLLVGEFWGDGTQVKRVAFKLP